MSVAATENSIFVGVANYYERTACAVTRSSRARKSAEGKRTGVENNVEEKGTGGNDDGNDLRIPSFDRDGRILVKAVW